MPSALPTESALDKSVKDFGIGTYDSQLDGSGENGEDSEGKPPKNLPDAGPPDVTCPDRFLSYPEEPDARISSWWRGIFAAAEVPGEADRPPTHSHPDTSVLDDRVTSVAEVRKPPGAGLPADSGNPAARSDYFDKTVTGGSAADAWAKEDSGAYVSQEHEAETALPSVLKNEESMDNGLQSLGNWQSGYEVEDVSGRQGFPTTDFAENVNNDRSDLQDGGRVLAADGRRWQMNRMATNIKHVQGLTADFLKRFGKKDLTKRHVLAFLRNLGEPQFLSSDVIRCLKLSHGIYVKDVLDEFPVAKQASVKARTASKIVQIHVSEDPNTVRVEYEGAIHSASWGDEEQLFDVVGDANLLRAAMTAWDGTPDTFYGILEIKMTDEELSARVGGDWTPRPTIAGGIASIRDRLIQLEIDNIKDPEVSSVFRRCAATLTRAAVAAERIENGNG